MYVWNDFAYQNILGIGDLIKELGVTPTQAKSCCNKLSRHVIEYIHRFYTHGCRIWPNAS